MSPPITYGDNPHPDITDDPIAAGKTYEVECPFVRTTYTEWDADGASEVPTWRPGVEWEMCAPDDSEAVADGVGKVLYEVVSVHELPGRYHARVFYIRQWIDPDGKQFGKRNLHIRGIQSFRKQLECYRFGGYENGFKMRPGATDPIADANERESEYWQSVGGRTDGVTEKVGLWERHQLILRDAPR